MALARLQSSLEAMPADTRRRAIEGLSKELRNELVSFMEAQGRRGMLPSRSMIQGEPTRSVSNEGNIWTFKTSSRQYHRARCQIGGVVVRSGSVQRREEAERLLSRLRQSMSSAKDLQERLVAADEAFQGSASFVVTLNARRWLGQTLESPTLRKLQDVLRWRQEAEAAEAAGWQSIRALWMDWQRLARPSQFQHRRRSAEQVNRLVHLGDVADQSWRLRKANRSVLRAARLQRSYGYAKRRAQRLLCRVMAIPRRHHKRKAPETFSEARSVRRSEIKSSITWYL